MWSGTATRLQMVEGDFGLALPFTVSGIELGASDCLKFTFKKSTNGSTILEKAFEGITDNTVRLEFTEEESALFSPGAYVFSLDWYQAGDFLGNIIDNGSLRVVDKA